MAGEMQKPRSPFVKSFTCKNCGAAVTIRNSRDSVIAFCESCGASIGLTDPNLKILGKAKQKVNYEPMIPLGTRGKLQGIEWEAIGYLRRRDMESSYTWEEYLLFNPYHGYRWLTHAQGHWNFVTMLKEKPNVIKGLDSKKIYYSKASYELFYRGRAQVDAVLGEFYWRVCLDETVEMEDYVHSPNMLSLEKDGSEQNWSLSEYMEPEVIRTAFKIKKAMPLKMGVAPNQPSKHAVHFRAIVSLWAIFSWVLILLQFVHVVTASNEQAFHQTYVYNQKMRSAIVTPAFELKHGLTNTSLQFNAPVSNTWISFDGQLVNDKTGETYPFNDTVEYYTGYDDGYWTEGSTERRELLSSIPEGTYYLDFDASAAGPFDTSRYVQPAPEILGYEVSIRRNILTWSNFLWAFFILSILPLWVWWRKHSFEVNRWSTSDYSPYATGDE